MEEYIYIHNEDTWLQLECLVSINRTYICVWQNATIGILISGYPILGNVYRVWAFLSRFGVVSPISSTNHIFSEAVICSN